MSHFSLFTSPSLVASYVIKSRGTLTSYNLSTVCRLKVRRVYGKAVSSFCIMQKMFDFQLLKNLGLIEYTRSTRKEGVLREKA